MSAICLIGLGLAGCGGAGDGDPTLAVYLSAPLSGPRADEGRDLAAGAELALAEAQGEAAGATVELEVLDGATERGWDAAATGANARRAIQDSTAIAYVGELDSGATRTSLPITNEAGLLQVSAGSGAEDLTRDALGGDEIPEDAQPSGVRTFGRVSVSDAAQGEAAAVWMAAEGIGGVELIESGDPFSAALIAGFEGSADAPPPAPGEDAEASYLALDSLDTGANVIPSGDGPIFASDALLELREEELAALPELCHDAGSCPSSPRELQLTSAALDPGQLPSEAAEFLAAFEEAEGRGPGRWGAYGYEAMALVLDSIERADDPLDRASVRDAFFATTDRESVLGTYSIDEVGDTTLGAVGAYEVIDGEPAAEPEPIALP